MRLMEPRLAPPKTLNSTRRLIDSPFQQADEALNGEERRKKEERTPPEKQSNRHETRGNVP